MTNIYCFSNNYNQSYVRVALKPRFYTFEWSVFEFNVGTYGQCHFNIYSLYLININHTQ